jgi:hypothetical protein
MADDDDINIFEEFYDSIKPGGSFDQGALNIGKAVTDVLTPNEQTQAEMDDYNKQRQDALNFLFSASGVDPESFQGKALESQFRQNKELQKLLGFDSNMLKELKYDFAKAGQFLFGDANVGLTTMQQEGTKFKELPFNQKLGIAMLPIDALDIIGLGVLAKGGLSPLIKTGMKVYGKKSGKTIQDLLNDEQVLKAIEAEQPGFIQELDTTLGGGIIQKRFMSGKKKRGPTPRERDEGINVLGRDFLQEQKQIKPGVDPQLEKAAKEADQVVNNFSQKYEAAYANKKNRLRAIQKLKKDVGEKEFNRLEKLSIQKGLSKKRNLAPEGSVKKTTPEGEKFIEENAAKLSATELKLAMTQDEATAAKFFYTDGMGNVKIPPDSFFRQYPSAQFGIIREGDVGTKGGKAKSEIAKEADQKIYNQFDIFTGAEGFNMNDPRAVREAFAKAFVSDASGSKYSGFDITSQDINFKRALARKINDYNMSKGFGEFDKTKGFEKGRVYNRNEIQQINRYLSVGEDSLEKTSIRNKFESYLNTNDIYNNLKNNMKQLDDSFYPVVDGVVKRDFSNKLKRYLNFIRETSAETRNPVQNSFDPFINEFGNDMLALLDPNSIEYQNFLKFSYHDKIREEVGELAKPALNKIFKAPKKRPDGSIRTEQERIDEAKNSVQIAHTFESSQVGETVGEGLTGAGMIPGSYYLDLSNYNAIKQPQLEKRARAAVDEFEATGDRSKLDQVDMELEELGAEVAVGDFVLGRHKTLAEKITDIIGGPPGSKQRELLKEQYGVTDEEIAQLEQAIDLLNEAGFRTGKVTAMQSGGLVQDVDDIFEEEQELREVPEQIKKIMPRISVEFGDAAKGTKRSFGEEKPEEDVFDIEQKTSAAPMTKTFDVQPTENIFTGEMEQANLKLPLWKLFTKPPVNETAPIPTPKENLDNPTKKQKQSLEQEKINKQDDVFDPTPEDNDKVNLVDDVTGMDIAVTPKTNQPITGVFYSDIERVLARPDTPEIFLNKKALLDFFRKNRIRDSEFRDYQIESLLRIYDENTPIPKQQVIDHLRQSPIRGMHVHATGRGSEIINPYGEKPTAYEGYAEPGYISGTQRERVLYIPNEKIPGDSGSYPVGIFPGESISNHAFGIPNQDDVYVVGWSRLTDRNAILPTKIAATKTQSKIPGLTRERDRVQRQLSGLFAEAQNKLNAQAQRRGIPVDEIQAESLEQMLSTYANTLNEISPGLVDQMDDLIVKARDLDTEIAKGSNIDTSGIVRVAFADEIQSDIMQAAAGRKQKLVATLRKIQDEGKESTTLPQLSRIGNQALEFFEENKSVFRPLKRSQTEVDLIGEKLVKLDAEVDEIINRYIETRELDPASVTRLKEALTQNIDEMINELIVIDSKTYEGLFPDIPFKKREEWADALIKKDLFELAYRKFVLKEENVPEYYAVTPDQFVIDRYNFKGNSATPMDVRAADKKAQIDYFTARGEFKGSEYKGIGMSEFYGGPNAKTPDGKHYTSTIEKILKTQAKSNNSELVVLNVQTKAGANVVYKITDQNGNMVATLTNQNQADRLLNTNPNYRVERMSLPTDKNTTPSFAIKITEEMLEPYKTHKAKGGLVEMIDIFEVA